MEQTITNTENIKGWGADLDKANRPAYPMWHEPEGGTGAHWDTPEQQKINFKEFHTIERPGMSAVIGTAVPPKGLSGLIRGFAFKYSESSFGHWLPLLLADRINVVEGLFQDLRRGHIPNIFAEMGLKSELKYNKKGLVKKGIVAGLFAFAFGMIFFMLKSNKRSSR